jgi:hypothetical protein
MAAGVKAGVPRIDPFASLRLVSHHTSRSPVDVFRFPNPSRGASTISVRELVLVASSLNPNRNTCTLKAGLNGGSMGKRPMFEICDIGTPATPVVFPGPPIHDDA